METPVSLVLDLARQRLEVIVERAGVRRKVVLSWASRHPQPVPTDWLSQVEKELSYQDGAPKLPFR